MPRSATDRKRAALTARPPGADAARRRSAPTPPCVHPAGALAGPLAATRREALVAGEELVTAITRHGDRDMASRELAQEVRRDGARVAERLVVVPHEALHEVHRMRLDDELRVLRAEVSCDIGGVRPL